MVRLIGLVLLLLAAPVLGRPVAGAFRVVSETAGVKVRIALSEPMAGALTWFTLPAPDRLVIDLPGLAAARREASGAGAIRSATLAQFDPQTARLVLSLAAPLRPDSARLVEGPVLEIALAPSSASAFTSARTSRQSLALAGGSSLSEVEAVLGAQAAPARPAATPPEQVRRASRRPLVVLDPGHGGKDVGAISLSGGHEKDVTLAVARAVARRLERSGKVDVRLTRSDDRFLTLGERVRLARGWGADLFISIHADSAPNDQARGASIYTLSETASDREAARLAAKENRADAIAGADLSGIDGEAQTVLIDLAMRDSMNASASFAQVLQGKMEPEGILFRTQFHRFAGFQVLRNLGVPAVLLECGYLSNAADSEFLFSDLGQKQLADGIARAAEAWLTAGGSKS
jgi:N-acetylmuramoyl-L-alanine amidase